MEWASINYPLILSRFAPDSKKSASFGTTNAETANATATIPRALIHRHCHNCAPNVTLKKAHADCAQI